MGTHTDFQGAIRIQPRLDSGLAERMDDFFSIRHMRRDVSSLEERYPAAEDCKPRSLLGDGNFGPEGEFFLPTEVRDLSIKVEKDGKALVEGICDHMDLNAPPKGCPSLYCDLDLVQPPEDNCTYLVWNEAEKAYYITEWIELIAKLLVPLGYNLDGQLFACVEYGISFYTITVSDTLVEAEDFDPPCTYEIEVLQAQTEAMERSIDNE